jgi:hypothetical protein
MQKFEILTFQNFKTLFALLDVRPENQTLVMTTTNLFVRQNRSFSFGGRGGGVLRYMYMTSGG